MDRTQLINYIIRQRNAKRYLEIGLTGKDGNFGRINCRYRVLVGQQDTAVFRGSSDEYFQQHHEKFDIILIDGVHTEEQVLKDVENALACLSPNGVIIIHDCLPPDKWHQRDPEQFKEGENWNGTVWKAVLRIFNRSRFKCCVLDTDWGCGIIDTAATQSALYVDLPMELDYTDHFKKLLTYKVSVNDWLRENIKVFYHLACIGNWREVFTEQVSVLEQSRFQWIDMMVLGTFNDFNWVIDSLQVSALRLSIVRHENDIMLFECPSLMAIQEYAKQHEGFVLYLHSKGVSNPADCNRAKWRRLMMNELVVNSEYCRAQLLEYDLIGVNWRDMQPIPHYCGNFWYASTQYIRKLPDFNHYYNHPRYRIWDTVNSKRLGCEFWIGASREQPRILSLVYRNEDFTNPAFWENKHN